MKPIMLQLLSVISTRYNNGMLQNIENIILVYE